MEGRRQTLATVGVMAVAFATVLAALLVLNRDDATNATAASPNSTAALFDPGDEVTIRGSAAVDGFLADYERSLDSTFRILADISREVDTGASISNRFELVQRPPRQVVRTITGTEVGALLSDQERAELTALVTGADSTYTVVGTAAGCWQLVLREFIPAAPLGTITEYCFDEATGAPMYIHTSRAEGTDTMVTIEVTGEVTDTDFE
ncbi:MAG: hypothetical protein GY745_12350 [Actinomycetia bacterium]|nr:hypothetical protein [Actinomycetes bacterium]MCP3912991.1 hypothetical protein [Actinomycetes bacterium]MCP4085828.1 hypothetical protein [Actinomycetes bacterium]